MSARMSLRLKQIKHRKLLFITSCPPSNASIHVYFGFTVSHFYSLKYKRLQDKDCFGVFVVFFSKSVWKGRLFLPMIRRMTRNCYVWQFFYVVLLHESTIGAGEDVPIFPNRKVEVRTGLYSSIQGKFYNKSCSV